MRNAVPPEGMDVTLYFRHEFTLGTATQSIVSDFEVAAEFFEVLDDKRRPLIRVDRSKEGRAIVSMPRPRAKLMPFIREALDPFTDTRFSEFLGERAMRSTSLLSDQFSYSGLFSDIKSALSGTSVFQLSPFQCRNSGVPTPNAVLERHGENLPGAANHLRRNDAAAWRRVQAAMRAIMPGLQEIDIAYTEDRRLALQFREHGVGRPWNTNEVSDGTVQSLALFIALFDRRHPLLVIEEPENSVHPWILRRIVDLCQDGESPKQIIMTTHSPVLLNYVNPAVVRLMSIKSGRSSIAPFLDFSSDLRDMIVDGRLSVFDAYDSGAVEQALPRGLVEDVE